MARIVGMKKGSDARRQEEEPIAWRSIVVSAHRAATHIVTAAAAAAAAAAVVVAVIYQQMSSECWNEVVIRTQVIGQIHRVYPHRRGSKLKYRFRTTPNGRRRTRRKTMRTIIHPSFPTVLRPRRRRVSNPPRGSGRHRRMSRRCPLSGSTGRRDARRTCGSRVVHRAGRRAGAIGATRQIPHAARWKSPFFARAAN